MLYIGLHLLLSVGVILLVWLLVKKMFTNLSQVKKLGLIIIVFFLICFITDLVFVQNHIDPFFAFPLWSASDGGSTYYIGSFYHIYKKVAYTLGDGFPPFFEYHISPWFSIIVR